MMANMLTNWFSSIRSADSESEMDGSLTSDLETTFLGLEMTGHSFNINESLLMSLPSCKTECSNRSESLLMSLPPCKTEYSNRSSCAKRKSSGHNGSHTIQLLDGTAITENTSPTILTTPRGQYLTSLDSPLESSGQFVTLGCGENLDSISTNSSQLQYMLEAATSPATKLNEETQTYLNQGQSYEIKLKKIGTSDESDGQLYRSIVRLVFHERRLQFLEREQLENWRQTRPGEKLVEIDIPLSYGLVDVRISPQDLNCLEFVWDPRRDTGIFVKVHCISTEFTAKKHGGEKGVPFRLQVETYRHGTRGAEPIVHCASCQIKVFKPKGADRKLKTDREKMEKKSDTDREKYQPPYEYTVMTDVPLDQVCFYLDQLNRHSEEKGVSMKPFQAVHNGVHPLPPNHSNHTLSYGGNQLPARSLSREQSGYRSVTGQNCSNPNLSSSAHCQTSVVQSVDSNHNLVDSSSFDVTRSPGTPSSTNSSNSSNSIANSCSLSASATESEASSWLAANRFAHLIRTFQNYSGADILKLSRTDMIEICGLSDGIRLNNAVMAKNVPPILTIYISLKPATSTGIDLDSNLVQSCFDLVETSTSLHLMSPNNHGVELCSKTSASAGECCDFSGLELERKPCLTSGSTKRHLYSKDDEDLENLSSVKRHCSRSESTVYFAVYLYYFTSQHLFDQLAAIQNLPVQHVHHIDMRTSSGVVVRITDLVIQNLSNESKFDVEILSDDANVGFYRLLLTPVSSSCSS